MNTPFQRGMRRGDHHGDPGTIGITVGGGRRGAAIILILLMLTTFAITAAITVDYAYMGLVQTELRVATDAAAKAGAEALSRHHSISEAKAAAVNYASLNLVAGQPLRIRNEDVTVGRLVWAQDGSWTFEGGNSSPNAVRVDGRTGGTALHPAIPLFFGNLVGTSTFSPQRTSTAGQQDVAICLCMDRSGSMLLDMSGGGSSFAPNNPFLSNFTSLGEVWRNFLSPANPVGSRWAVLEGAIEIFLKEAQQYNPPPRTALVTWASDYTMPVAPSTVFQAATIDVPIPPYSQSNGDSNLVHIRNAVRQLGRQQMMGATNLSAGLDKAVAALSVPEAGAFANKVIILMTDGIWNEGRDPLAAAQDARNAGITVHTVTMLTAYQPTIEQIALLTGGRHFTTNNEAELRHAFRELGRSLEVVLVD